MYTVKIWHISSGRRFPFDFQSVGRFQVELEELPPDEMPTINPDPQLIHLFCIQGENGQADYIRDLLEKSSDLIPYLRVLIVPENEYQEHLQGLRGNLRIALIDDSIRSDNLRLLLETLINNEYYRAIIQTFARDLRGQSRAFDGFRELARKELAQSKEESAAFQRLLDYESSYRDFEGKVEKAMQEALALKDREVVELTSRMQAMERLSEFRDKELKDARETLDAAQKALDLSRTENMEREKIIDALQRLNIYTDQEVVELFRENEELRKKLGMPPREG
ncbi:MAG: hypothetical protein KDK23_06230 [Leptospiraceae bacterium]|nr:hypothetical protein [Leptospiraceae bacterium]